MDYEVQLIDYVRLYPYFYDMYHPEYKNKEKKDETWAHIARSLGISEQKARTRWKSLRNNFRVIHDKVEANHEFVPTWRFYEQLKFLVNFTHQYSKAKSNGSFGHGGHSNSLLVAGESSRASYHNDNSYMEKIDDDDDDDEPEIIETKVDLNYFSHNNSVKNESESPMTYFPKRVYYTPHVPDDNNDTMSSNSTPKMQMSESNVITSTTSRQDEITLFLRLIGSKIAEGNLSRDKFDDIQEHILSLVNSKLREYRLTK